jgi:hypothetical protein
VTEFGFSHTLDIPAQVVSGFYTASADTNIVGGTAFVKILFYPDPPSAANSGIREAKK